MFRNVSPFALVALLLLAGCTGADEGFGSPGPGGDSDDDEDTDVTDDTAADDTGDDPVEEDTPTFESPGDSSDFEDDGGDAQIDLTDRSETDPASNQDQEFFLVLVNTGESELGYQLRYDVPEEDDTGDAGTDDGADAPMASQTSAAAPRGPSHFRRNLRDAKAAGRLGAANPDGAPPPPLDASDVGTARQEFRVRDSVTDDSSFDLVDAKLWALGDTVAIWVDDDVAIDWDFECDGVIDVVDSRNAYGFDNCDLVTIANIVDLNIVPNVREAFGLESDVNADGKVAVVVTPVLNYMTQFSEDEDSAGTLVGSYADPEVDLTDFDVEENPMSDEQEVIYVHAPDPYGFLNAYAPVTIQAYTGLDLAAEIARAYTRLVSYNNKVLSGTGAGEADETWIQEGLAALAADLTGFGAVNHPAVWDYLDAPHVYSLVLDDDASAISTAGTWGAQYLFLRWLTDNVAPSDDSAGSLMEQIVQGANNGAEGIANATGQNFEDLVVQWQVALLTTGVTTADGEPLMMEVTTDETTGDESLKYPPYEDASSLTAPIENPSSGDFYGANGYQQGINVRGINVQMEGGTSDAPTEVLDERVTTSGTDHLTMVTGFPFYGYVAGDFGAQVVRPTDIPFDEASLIVDAAGTGFQGTVIRWTDPTRDDTAVEDIFSSTDANSLTLPSLPSDGTPIYGVGSILPPGATTLVAEDGSGEPEVVYDTDRWILSLTDRAAGQPVKVAVQLDRRYGDTSGDIGLYDPWVAVVEKNLVPTPTVDGTSSGVCTDGPTFGYPATLLTYLYPQVFLSAYGYVDGDGAAPATPGETGGGDDTGDGEEDSSAWNPCGVPEDGGSAATTCATDWDRDGVLNDEEPQPASFVQQVQVMQCTLAAGDFDAVVAAGGFYNTDIIDSDETDEDDVPYVDRSRNLGGRTGEEDEEAYIELELEGGQEYVIVVGGQTDQGVYEFSVTDISD
jgi:hypothetical protein